ncbi:MAG: ATPase domain-containing protein [Candidatus Micrarchaeia archaeon]
MANKANPPQEKRGKAAKEDNAHIFTGVPGLDAMLGIGIPAGSSVLIEGGPGSGKTMLCLAIASHHCKIGKKVLYMSFEEPEKRLIEHLEPLDKDVKKYIGKDLLRLKRFNALDVARSVEALLSEAKKELLIDVNPVFFPEDFKPDLVLIDSLTSISSAFSGEDSRFRIYMEQLFRYLEKENISSFLIREVANPSHTGKQTSEAGEAVSFLSDGIIIIYNVLYPGGERGTGIEILKMRGAEIQRKIVKMKIGADGITVFPEAQIPAGSTLT